MQKLTIEDLKKPAERPMLRDVPLCNGTTADFRGMLEGERIEFMKEHGDKPLRPWIIVWSLMNGEGPMLTPEDIESDWWLKLDSQVVDQMLKASIQVCGFDDDFDPEAAAKNSEDSQA